MNHPDAFRLSPPPHGLLTFTGGGGGFGQGQGRVTAPAGYTASLGRPASLGAPLSDGGPRWANTSMVPAYLQDTSLACGFMCRGGGGGGGGLPAFRHGPLHAGATLEPWSGDPSHLLAQVVPSHCVSPAPAIPPTPPPDPLQHPLELAPDGTWYFGDGKR